MDERREKVLEQAKSRVQQQLSRKDLPLMQAIRCIDDLDKAKALVFERLQEWFKLDFPELSFQNEETYCKFVAAFGSKDAVQEAELEKIVGNEKTQQILEKARRSFGSRFDEDDRKAVSALASHVLSLFAARKEMEEYVRKASSKEFANLSFICDPMLAARLVEISGSLEKLAKMPASTIQVLGAEKALFTHLRKGTKPPKHGVIFQFPGIRTAPLKQRGRIARDLAANLAIAAKADFYTKRFIGPQLKERFEKRLKEIKES